MFDSIDGSPVIHEFEVMHKDLGDRGFVTSDGRVWMLGLEDDGGVFEMDLDEFEFRYAQSAEHNNGWREARQVMSRAGVEF